QFLDQGKAGITELMDVAQKYGDFLTEDNVRDIHAAELAHKDFDQALKGIQLTLAKDFLPALVAGMAGLAEIARIVNEQAVPALQGLSGGEGFGGFVEAVFKGGDAA